MCFFSPCSLKTNSPRFTFIDSWLLTSPGYLFRKQLLEECVLILSSRTWLLWPSDLRLTQPALFSASAQLCSSGSLVPTLWRRPSCFNLVSISVEAVPDWKRLGREFQGENWVWLGEIFKTSVLSAKWFSDALGSQYESSCELWELILPTVRQPWLLFCLSHLCSFHPVCLESPSLYKPTPLLKS